VIKRRAKIGEKLWKNRVALNFKQMNNEQGTGSREL